MRKLTLSSYTSDEITVALTLKSNGLKVVAVALYSCPWMKRDVINSRTLFLSYGVKNVL